jgi:hypothetical protein
MRVTRRCLQRVFDMCVYLRVGLRKTLRERSGGPAHEVFFRCNAAKHRASLALHWQRSGERR